MRGKREKKSGNTGNNLVHESNPPILTYPNTLQSWQQAVTSPGWKSCYLRGFGSHIKTPAAHRPLSSHLPREISLCRNGVDYVDLEWNGLLEQSKCQNVTNLAEPSVPKPQLSIPTKEALLVWRMSSSSAALEDIVDLTTTWWFSFETTKRHAKWNLPYLLLGVNMIIQPTNTCLTNSQWMQVIRMVSLLIWQFMKLGNWMKQRRLGGQDWERRLIWREMGKRRSAPTHWPWCARPLSGHRQRRLLVGLVLIMGPKALPRLFVMPELWQAEGTVFVKWCLT